MTRRERGRKGGQTTAARYGREHMRAIGRRGGLATVAKHGRSYMSSIGGRGFEATVRRYWQGDKEAFKRWLVRAGQWATDPFPANGAVKPPGPWPGAGDDVPF